MEVVIYVTERKIKFNNLQDYSKASNEEIHWQVVENTFMINYLTTYQKFMLKIFVLFKLIHKRLVTMPT